MKGVHDEASSSVRTSSVIEKGRKSPEDSCLRSMRMHDIRLNAEHQPGDFAPCTQVIEKMNSAAQVREPSHPYANLLCQMFQASLAVAHESVDEKGFKAFRRKACIEEHHVTGRTTNV